MFDQTFVNTNGKTRRPWTVAVSLTLQTVLAAVALIIPLLRVASLDLPPKIPILFPVEKVDLKLKPETKPDSNRVPTASRPVFHLAALQAPAVVPRRIDLSSDLPEIANSISTTGQAGPSLGALLPEMAIAPPQPHISTVKAPPATPQEPVRVGSGVQSAKLIFEPKPAYPPLARTTRTQGTVRIQAVIGRDGAIKNLQLIGGPPLLVAVAMDAVRQWRYQPTLLNGEPIEVITVIDVNFTLSQ